MKGCCGESSIGEYEHFITIESPTRTADGVGGFTTSWSSFGTSWARIEPRSATQIWHSEQLEHRVTHKVTIPYLSGILSDFRFVFETTRIFHIRGVQNVTELDETMELMCEEGTGVAS